MQGRKMETSKRAVEAYWRTRLIDQVTIDDDKIAPVYRLDEICDTIRSSSFNILREMLDYTFKRLDQKSPRVKQKSLRLIKYTAGKAGPEYKRELQRQSGAIRQLFHYRGQVDAIRGDALNKAVRDTAHEAINAIFASDDKPSSLEESSKRIQGFGNTNFDSRIPEKKSLLDEVVGFGSASIRQGLTLINSYSNNTNGGRQNDSSGSYRGPTLRKSLTSEREMNERHLKDDFESSRDSLRFSDQRTETSLHESELPKAELNNGRPVMHNGRGTSQEERLIDTITAPGGVRLQPTRESLNTFLLNALKLDPVNLSHALESKLQSHSWQVRLKTLCALEAILRQKDQQFCMTVAAMFEENAGPISESLKSPQTSLREKAKKVLDLLGASNKQESFDEKSEEATAALPVMETPDLIDTRESNVSGDADIQPDVSPSATNDTASKIQSSTQVIDVFGDTPWSDSLYDVPDTGVDDPFAGVSFHTPEGSIKDITEDLFSGLSIDGNKSSRNASVGGLGNDEDVSFDGLNVCKSNIQDASQPSAPSESLVDLIGSLSMNSVALQNGGSECVASVPMASSMQIPEQGNYFSAQMLGNVPNPQMVYLNPSLMLPMGVVPNFRPNMILPQSFTPGTMGFGTMADALTQQQLIARMANLQRFGMAINLGNTGNLQGNTVPSIGISTSFPDHFDFSSDITSRCKETTDSRKKEETKAFDFISEHVSAARGLKRTA